MPLSRSTILITGGAGLRELFAFLFRMPSSLTRDVIAIGRVSYFGDTTRAREELVSELAYPDLESRLEIL